MYILGVDHNTEIIVIKWRNGVGEQGICSLSMKNIQNRVPIVCESIECMDSSKSRRY